MVSRQKHEEGGVVIFGRLPKAATTFIDQNLLRDLPQKMNHGKREALEGMGKGQAFKTENR
jgi:hypothetical protein